MEPPVTDELQTASRTPAPQSKHQQYMRELSVSGKSLAEIQTAWHEYYRNLSDAEKHQVWQEFYAANRHAPARTLPVIPTPASTTQATTQNGQYTHTAAPMANLRYHTPYSVAANETFHTSPVQPQSEQPFNPLLSSIFTTPSNQPQIAFAPQPAKPTVGTMPNTEAAAKPRAKKRSRMSGQKLKPIDIIGTIGTISTKQKTGPDIKDIQARIRRTVSANGTLTLRHHVQSLLFGLGMGSVVLVILLFGFFNEMVIAPLIQPSRTVTDQPIIVGSSAASQSAQPTVIVPKINIQIPVDFSVQSNEESAIQSSLENGVVHYPSTVLPGQNGNGAYFGHSSQNIFNNGKYKFAFVLLHQLTTGDVFYVTYSGKVYAYQVFAREIVPPTQVGVLNDTKGKQATAVLITCDPPGLSTNRLVVWGEQISPSPVGNTASAPRTTQQPPKITDNGPTLWHRITDGLTFWN